MTEFVHYTNVGHSWQRDDEGVTHCRFCGIMPIHADAKWRCRDKFPDEEE